MISPSRGVTRSLSSICSLRVLVFYLLMWLRQLHQPARAIQESRHGRSGPFLSRSRGYRHPHFPLSMAANRYSCDESRFRQHRFHPYRPGQPAHASGQEPRHHQGIARPLRSAEAHRRRWQRDLLRAGNGTLEAARVAAREDRGRLVHAVLRAQEAIAYAIADNRTAQLAFVGR